MDPKIELIALALAIPVYLYYGIRINKRLFPYATLSTPGKVLNIVCVLAILVIPCVLAIILISSQPFTRQQKFKGVITGTYYHPKRGFYYRYSLDKDYTGTVDWDEHLSVGDTIDIFRDWDGDISKSYAAFDIYRKSYGMRTKYKKYYDKIVQSEGDKNKVVGTMP